MGVPQTSEDCSVGRGRVTEPISSGAGQPFRDGGVCVIWSRPVSKQQGAVSRALTRPALRPGEYATLPVTRRVTAQPGGASVAELSLDLLNAPVPDRRYCADGVLVRRTAEAVQLIFGQTKVTSAQLQSMVVIKLSFDATRSLLATFTEFSPRLRGFIETNKVHKSGKLQISEEEPSQTVVMSANIAAIAYVGREGCVDFYHASPFAFRALGNDGTQLPVDAVVRVEVATGTLLSMVEQLEEMKDQLPEPIRQENGK